MIDYTYDVHDTIHACKVQAKVKGAEDSSSAKKNGVEGIASIQTEESLDCRSIRQHPSFPLM